MALPLVSASRKKKICSHSGSLTSYFNYIKQQATTSFRLSGIPAVPTRNQGSKCWSLGDNTGITLSLSFLLRKTSKGKVSAKYKFLAMETQSSDQKRWSLPVKPTNQPSERQSGEGLLYACNRFIYICLRLNSQESRARSRIKGLTFYFRATSPRQWEGEKKEQRAEETRLALWYDNHCPGDALPCATKERGCSPGRHACSCFRLISREGS